ncbi:hypothetical protein ACJMK2_024456 [Sinanodonta woodiana]|uniref:DUF4773 domain-containing protein n=1 Tax=Sinanodonta woodiana TaxID=1069815 RepID=A0ABD3XHC7_SINWO
MARTSIFIMLVGAWMGIKAGQFVQEETEFRIEDDAKSALHGGDLRKAFFVTILGEDFYVNAFLGKAILQYQEAKIADVSLMDSSWSMCLPINIKIPGIHVNTQICVNLELLRANMGVRGTIRFGSYTYVKEISVSNPPAICDGILAIRPIKVCVQFYNINRANTSVCVLVKIYALSRNIGCFNLGKEKRLSQHPHTGQFNNKSETDNEPNSVKIFQE